MAQAAVEIKGTDTTALITGSEAIAVACKLADVDVITGYPIRPYDTVMQYVAKLVANGDFDCEYIIAEGEHSQFEIVKHASTVGARVFCGSSGVGWMYAFECLTVTPALRKRSSNSFSNAPCGMMSRKGKSPPRPDILTSARRVAPS